MKQISKEVRKMLEERFSKVDKVEGWMGEPIDSFTKEELLMLLAIKGSKPIATGSYEGGSAEDMPRTIKYNLVDDEKTEE